MPEEKIKWVKKGGGSATLTIDGKEKVVNAGDVFTAKESELPQGALELFDVAPSRAALKQQRAAERKGAPPPANDDEGPDNGNYEKAEFEVVQADNAPGWYDVINKANGKVMNEKKLRAEEAQTLVKELTEGDG